MLNSLLITCALHVFLCLTLFLILYCCQGGNTGQRLGSTVPTEQRKLNITNRIIFYMKELEKVADLVTANTIFCTKEVLTSQEAARYMGISISYLYKLTMRQQIPHYKPMGKMCYFNRAELETWLQSNRVSTEAEISQKAQAHCMKKGGAR